MFQRCFTNQTATLLTAVGALLLLLLPAAAQRNPPPAAKPAARVMENPKAGPKPEKSVEILTASALKSIVVITHFGRDGHEDGVGAGFVVSSDGLIATSLHVIGEARPISVRLPDGQNHEVTEVHAWDRKLDLAVIRIDAKGLAALPLGDSDALKQGAPVLALGNPLGLEHSVVQGVLSARREVEGNTMLQLAIPIEPGNSGGPLLDLTGRVEGILTLKSALSANLGFAMPVNLLKTLLDRPNPVPLNRWLTLGALNPKEWSTLLGARWNQKGGRIRVESPGNGFGGRSLCLSQKPAPARPYEVAVDVRLDDEAGAAGLVFGSDGGDRHYGFYPSAGQMRLTRFDGPTVYSWVILKQIPTEHYRRGEWNQLRVRVESGKILCFVNDQLVAESDDHELRDGRVGLAKFRDTRAEFRAFQVGTNLAAGAAPSTNSVPAALRQDLDPAGGPTDARPLGEFRGPGPADGKALAQRAAQLEREAQRLRRLATALHRQTVQTELLKVLDQPEERIDLLHAALLVARLDNPDVEPAIYLQQVAAMAAEIASRFNGATGEQARLEALRRYLFAENGFHGSRSDYHNRANSYLNEVIEDREGQPITLSVLFLELAGRLGIRNVSGLPLPGHFMIRYAPPKGDEKIIDVFNGGRTLSRTEAQEKIIETTGEGFTDAAYRSATKREIILRIVHNLLGSAERGGAPPDTLAYLDLLLALAPDSVEDRLSRARVRLQTGDNAGAKRDFKWLLDQQPAGLDLERIAEAYRSL